MSQLTNLPQAGSYYCTDRSSLLTDSRVCVVFDVVFCSSIVKRLAFFFGGGGTVLSSFKQGTMLERQLTASLHALLADENVI